MKKLFTLIAVTSAIIPAAHGMDTNLPAELQKQYNNLTALIQNADVDVFKQAFDALTLSNESVAALRQTIVETKTTITNELDAMGDKNINWSKIAKGGLASIGGFWAGVSIPAALCVLTNKAPNNNLARIGTLIGSLPTIVPSMLIARCIEKIIKPYTIQRPGEFCILAVNALAYLGIAYKTIPYGIKTFKAGLNYKEHLQNMLANLDAIDAYITHAKA